MKGFERRAGRAQGAGHVDPAAGPVRAPPSRPPPAPPGPGSPTTRIAAWASGALGPGGPGGQGLQPPLKVGVEGGDHRGLVGGAARPGSRHMPGQGREGAAAGAGARPPPPRPGRRIDHPAQRTSLSSTAGRAARAAAAGGRAGAPPATAAGRSAAPARRRSGSPAHGRTRPGWPPAPPPDCRRRGRGSDRGPGSAAWRTAPPAAPRGPSRSAWRRGCGGGAQAAGRSAWSGSRRPERTWPVNQGRDARPRQGDGVDPRMPEKPRILDPRTSRFRNIGSVPPRSARIRHRPPSTGKARSHAPFRSSTTGDDRSARASGGGKAASRARRASSTASRAMRARTMRLRRLTGAPSPASTGPQRGKRTVYLFLPPLGRGPVVWRAPAARQIGHPSLAR